MICYETIAVMGKQLRQNEILAFWKNSFQKALTPASVKRRECFYGFLSVLMVF